MMYKNAFGWRLDEDLFNYRVITNRSHNSAPFDYLFDSI